MTHRDLKVTSLRKSHAYVIRKKSKKRKYKLSDLNEWIEYKSKRPYLLIQPPPIKTFGLNAYFFFSQMVLRPSALMPAT